MQRFLIVMCIIAALMMAAFKPARGASTGTEKCAASKISATGKSPVGASELRTSRRLF